MMVYNLRETNNFLKSKIFEISKNFYPISYYFCLIYYTFDHLALIISFPSFLKMHDSYEKMLMIRMKKNKLI